MNVFDQTVRNEEAKRNRCWSPRGRWAAILAGIAWAEKQAAAGRNAPAARLAEQKRKLARLTDSRPASH